jgi:hypothetical protein
VWLGATSAEGAPARASFDYLCMSRITGQAQLDDRLAIAEELQPLFPEVRLLHGIEYSYGAEGGHRHHLGGELELPDFPAGLPARSGKSLTNEELVAKTLAAGGMPIANHPFGTNGKRLTQAQAEFHARDYVARLKANDAEGGLQGIETYYRTRAGASLEQHLFLAYSAIRNGMPLTLSGVSDNHWGRNGSWIEEKNHFVTGVYAATTSDTDLVDALRRGRAYTAEIGSYNGRIDLAFDDDETPVVMGQIDVRPGLVSRRLRILASALPKTGLVEVHQIPLDDSLDGDPGGVIAVLPASAFSNGVATVSVPVDRDSAFTVHVGNQRSASKPIKRIGGSNPIWHLNAEPTTWTIPDHRRVAG